MIDERKKEIENEKYILTFDGIEEYLNYDNVNNPYNFRSWWNTITISTDAPFSIRVKLYESALKFLPGSYKLWYHYLKEAREYVKQWSVDDKRYEIINQLHEKALVFMNKMPRIWLDYTQFLIDQRLVTQTRVTYDKALMSLPVTQHEKIWGGYIDWVINLPLTQTAQSVFKRYLKFNPDAREDYAEYLLSNNKYKESLTTILHMLDDDLFHPKKGRSRFDYWIIVCEIITKYSDDVADLDCESVIRSGLSKYTDEVGRLWVAMCNYYIKQGLFEKARDIFEEALSKVSTARDFSIVFNSYLKFEEELVSNWINLHNQEDPEESEYEEQLDSLIENSFRELGLNDKINSDISLNKSNKIDNELELKFFRLTNLIERRPFLLSDAILRQNKNNIKEWLKRVKLSKDDNELTINTFEKAVNTVDPNKAYGRYDTLWIDYARFYESKNEIGKANETFIRAINTKPTESIFCEFAEMHIRLGNSQDAYIIVKTGCNMKLIRPSIKLWSAYVDLEEQLGSIENTKNIYQRMIDLKIANAQTIFNYCDFLEKHLFFEETFKIFEQSLNNFTWPSLYDIWIVYIQKFIDRYRGEKVERTRDLFEQVVNTCPKDKIKIFYYMWADFEENYGLLNNAIRILDRACNDVIQSDRPEVFSVLISKTANFFGITKTRTVFNRALEILEPDQIVDIGSKYASIEKKLGEIDRARAIYTYLSQFSEPTVKENLEGFWKTWEEFELTHGNEETFREMLRIKNSVAARFSLNTPLFISDNKIPI